MKRIFSLLVVLILGVGLIGIGDAEAKRFGGGKSFGSQRQATPQRQVDKPAPAAQPAGATPRRNSWMGPLAGLAAGLGLAALMSNFGLGEEFADILLILLLVVGGFLLFRFLTRPKAQPAGVAQYAGMGAGGQPVSFPGSAAPDVAPAAVSSGWPAGFDPQAFAREAKLNFLRLQAAYDAANLDDIREFTTPEVFAEIRLQLDERPAGEHRTEVVTLEAEVLDAVEEGSRLIVSVRFHGMIREAVDAVAEAFDEQWNLSRSAHGGGGWVVAGIQQNN